MMVTLAMSFRFSCKPIYMARIAVFVWTTSTLVFHTWLQSPLYAETPERREEQIFGDETDPKNEKSQQDVGVPPDAVAPAVAAPPFDSIAAEKDMFSEDSGNGEAISRSNLMSLGEDILQIGGQLYLRSAYVIQEDAAFSDNRFLMPNLLDVYFDARPNDRVRGFVRGRLTYDPTTTGAATEPYGSSHDNPDVLLDQLWLKFDISRVVYATVGKQPVKWGTSRFWNPADILYGQLRDPLTLFDERTGLSLVKLHIPVESLGWNFYVIGMFDDAASLADVGGAFRGEFVWESVELGVSAAVRDGVKTKFGVDISAGIFDVDVYAETTVSLGVDKPVLKLPEGVDPDLVEQAAGLIEDLIKPPGVDENDTVVRIAAGLTYGIRYSDEDSLFLGGEYFFNPIGYDDKDLYPLLYALNIAQPLYVGRHYGAVYVAMPQPGSWDDTSFTLSAIGNFSDFSFLTRLDVAIRVLTYLNIEVYAAGHLGAHGGELRFGTDPLQLPTGDTVPAIAAPMVDLGFNLKLSI
ncbi:MAG: hypothetical protein HUU55_14100 [Myxococcales bacterium]|nr:hypothetical protein [Myxococcales bacterium]